MKLFYKGQSLTAIVSEEQVNEVVKNYLENNQIGMDNIPSGLIAMWSGTEVPDGWLLCDGTNNTPDLTDKFVLGGVVSDVGKTGGESEVTLTVEQMPSHSHNVKYYVDTGTVSTLSSFDKASTASPRTIRSESTGNSLPHNNMPPYYVLAFIMKK